MSHDPTSDLVRSLDPSERLVFAGSLYFGEDDFLRLDAYNSVASLVVTLSGVFVNPAGEVRPFSFLLAPSSDRLVTTTRVRFGEGFLIHATVRVTTGTALRGQCFVNLAAQRWSGTGGLVFATLLADYVTTRFSPVWPGGPLKSPLEGQGALVTFIGTNPAVNVEATVTVPTGARWRLMTVAGVLVTDGNAATRVASLRITDGTNLDYQTDPTASQIASLTRFYFGSTQSLYTAALTTNLVWPLPSALFLEAGSVISTVTTLRQATDDWAALIVVAEEWITD